MKSLAQFLLIPVIFSMPGTALAADAAALLTAMAQKLSGTSQFSVTMHIRYDAVQPSGKLIEFSERREILVDRPRRMRVESRQSDGTEGGLIIDGSAITQFDLAEAVYSQVEQTQDLDATIRYAVGELNIRFPLARMLVSDLAVELERLVERVAYVETGRLDEEVLEHIAAVGANVDAQFWIRPDKLPSRIVLVYRDVPGQPHFSADFSDWNLAPDINRNSFEFKPPPGAEKIPLLKRVARDKEEVAQ